MSDPYRNPLLTRGLDWVRVAALTLPTARAVCGGGDGVKQAADFADALFREAARRNENDARPPERETDLWP